MNQQHCWNALVNANFVSNITSYYPHLKNVLKKRKPCSIYFLCFENSITSNVNCANLNQEWVKLLALLNAKVVSAERDMLSKKRSVAEEAESVKALPLGQ